MKYFIVCFLFILGFFASGPMARADEGISCVLNQTKASLHVLALDASRYEADVKPGSRLCCGSKACKSLKKGKATSLLIVTGYVPVAKEQRPGWKAQCKAKPNPGQTVVVTGNTTKISCTVK